MCKLTDQAEGKGIWVVKEFSTALHALIPVPSEALLNFCPLSLWDTSLCLSQLALFCITGNPEIPKNWLV